MRSLILLLIVCITFSCATMPGMPGNITETNSAFDGSRQIQMEPAWLPYSPIKLALYKNTKMKTEEVLLTVVIKGAHNFSRGNSLLFNIDGNIISFKSIDLLTNINTSSGHYANGLYLPPFNWSSKDYLITKSLVKNLIEAKRVVVKVNLNKTYVEGVFSQDGISLARPAFRKFYKKMDTLK